jgi:hypothetical protein
MGWLGRKTNIEIRGKHVQFSMNVSDIFKAYHQRRCVRVSPCDQDLGLAFMPAAPFCTDIACANSFCFIVSSFLGLASNSVDYWVIYITDPQISSLVFIVCQVPFTQAG